MTVSIFLSQTPWHFLSLSVKQMGAAITMLNNIFTEWNWIHSIIYLYKIRCNYTGHKLHDPITHVKLLVHFGTKHTIFGVHVLKKNPKKQRSDTNKKNPLNNLTQATNHPKPSHTGSSIIVQESKWKCGSPFYKMLIFNLILKQRITEKRHCLKAPMFASSYSTHLWINNHKILK